MPVLIPVNNYGNREITVDTRGGGVYRFRSYYSMGQYDGWFVDIADAVGTMLLRGVRVVPGSPNLLKGQGDNFRDVQMACVVLSGNETTSDALGNGTYLVWFNPGETNPFKIGDPLIDIPWDEWAFSNEVKPSGSFWIQEKGELKVAAIVVDGTVDAVFTLDAAGVMRVKKVAAAGATDGLWTLGADGALQAKG